jgi:hypothetical protein
MQEVVTFSIELRTIYVGVSLTVGFLLGFIVACYFLAAREMR